MKTRTILIHGVILGTGMLLFMGLCFGAFQYLQNGGLHYHALVIWMSILALAGFGLRRWVWRQRSDAWRTTGSGFALFMLALLVVGLVAGDGNRMPSLEQGGLMMFLFVPWFWLPFAIGVLAGGFRSKTSEPNKPERLPAVQP